MHDLRRIFRTNTSKGVANFVTAEVMLGHAVGSSVARVYDHYDYLKEQAEAYEDWCRKLHEMVGEKLPEPSNDNIVELRERKSGLLEILCHSYNHHPKGKTHDPRVRL